MANEVPDRVSSRTDGSGTPRSLLVFAIAVLTAVAGVVVVASTESAWALVVAVCVLLLLLAAVLRELESETGGRPVPATARDAGGAVAGAASPAWRGPAAHRRLLLVASEPVSATQLAAILEGEPRGSTAVLVVAPALDRTWLRYWVSDDDEGIEHARTVEAATLDALQRERVSATGHVGSADPITAIDDALRFFDADRIVIAMHSGGERRFRERDLRAEVERRFGVPTYAIDPGRA
jgi:hypothetical protein